MLEFHLKTALAHLPNVEDCFQALVDRKNLAPANDGHHIWGEAAADLAQFHGECALQIAANTDEVETFSTKRRASSRTLGVQAKAGPH